MEPVITYRLTETGLWSYHFYAGRRMIGKASSALSLSAVVRIEAGSVSWYSMFHIGADSMPVPGISRAVMDDHTGLEVYRIVYCEPGFYRLLGREQALLVECRGNAYLFGNPGQPVLALTERIRECDWVPAGEPFFRTTVYEENVSEEMQAAMLAFPALRF